MKVVTLLGLVLLIVSPVFAKPTDVEAYKTENKISYIEPVILSSAEYMDLKLHFKLEIAQDGSVKSIKSLDKASPVLIDSIESSLLKWKFAPGKKNVILPITINSI